MTTRTRSYLAPCLAALCGLALGQAALAQNVLDRNLQVGSGGVNPTRPSFADEVRFRNAIVTGNAPGGLSFRGDVGYRAPGEFQGRLGSDQTFSFRRDAVYSGLGGMGIRGTDALQYQFAMTTGNAPPRGLGVQTEFLRAGARSTAGSVIDTRPRETGLIRDDSTPRTQPRTGAGDDNLSLLAIRSPSSFAANRGLQPALVGLAAGPDGSTQGVTASVLRGISTGRLTAPGAPDQDPSLNPYHSSHRRPSETRPGEQPRPTSPDAAPAENLQTGLTPDRPDSRLENTAASTRTPYTDLLERFKTAAAEAPPRPGVPIEPTTEAPLEPEWQRRLNELRAQLAEPRRPAAGEPRPGETPEGPAPNAPRDETGEKLDQKPRPDRPRTTPDERRSGLSPETIEMIRRAGGEVGALAPESFDAYGTQMLAGQELLAQARFFDAEERFTAALSAKPGDPMAAVGRIHAELGAGMVLSAANNLRALFADHPVVTSARYGPELLPSKERMAKTAARLSELAAEPGRGRNAALLLAYVGHLTRDQAAVKRGLDLLGNPGDEGIPAEGDELTRLAALLRGVWITPPPGGENK